MDNSFVCLHCGKVAHFGNGYQIAYEIGGGRRYVCSDCNHIRSYSTDNESRVHIPAKHGFSISAELECIPYNGSIWRNNYSFMPTHDASLPVNGIEFKTPIWYNSNGLKQLFESLEPLADFNGGGACGQHINIGHSDLTPDIMVSINNNAAELFNPLGCYLKNHKDDTVRIYGRYFNEYATADINGTHCDFINTLHSSHIEFRLSHFVNGKQYFTLIQLCIEMVSCILNNYVPYINSDAISHKIDITAEKLIRVFKKYASGGAACQEIKRNTSNQERVEAIKQYLNNQGALDSYLTGMLNSIK